MGDVFDDTGRVSGDGDEVRNVFGHNAAGPNGDALTDGDAGEHDAVAPEPTVGANFDGLSVLGTCGAVPQDGVQRMRSAVEGTVGADESPVTDLNSTRVDPHAVEVDVDILPQPMCS